MKNSFLKTDYTQKEQTLDITDLICPMTFVRTKLTLESMPVGSILTVRLKGTEPLENVPRSARQHGHTVLGVEPEGDDGVHIVKIKKEGV